MKRFLSFVLVLLAFLSLSAFAAQGEIWDGSIATSFGGGSGTEDDPYQIYDGAQLAYLAQQVNSVEKFSEGKYFKLMNDIKLNDTTNWESWDTTAPSNVWIPIGNRSYYFQGTFDGQGYEISGVYINSSSDYQGLFGYVYSGIVENVGVVDSYIKGDWSVGGVVGYNVGTVSNCYNSGSVSGSFYVGGVVGYNDYGTVSDCYNSGEVTGLTAVGGVVGDNYYGTVSNCYNTGTVSGSDYYVGGVVGDNYGTVSNCYNSGSVTGPGSLGGVVGVNLGTVSNCYNTGTVSVSDDYVGGVVGVNLGTVSNCYNSGSVSGSYYVGGVVGENYSSTVSNCYNSGSVSGSYYVGGVVGYNSGSITNTYYLTGFATDGNGTVQYGVGYETTDSTTADTDDKTKGLTSAQMKQQSSFVGFDFTNIWAIAPNKNDGYPYLKETPVSEKSDTQDVADTEAVTDVKDKTDLDNEPDIKEKSDKDKEVTPNAQDETQSGIIIALIIVIVILTAVIVTGVVVAIVYLKKRM